MTDGAPPLGVGMVGYAFMGAVHSQAWRTVQSPSVGKGMTGVGIQVSFEMAEEGKSNRSGRGAGAPPFFADLILKV